MIAVGKSYPVVLDPWWKAAEQLASLQRQSSIDSLTGAQQFWQATQSKAITSHPADCGHAGQTLLLEFEPRHSVVGGTIGPFAVFRACQSGSPSVLPIVRPVNASALCLR